MASGVGGISQDSLYAKTVDSLWNDSYNTRLLSKRRATVAEAKVTYSIYKSSGKMRTIISLNKSAKENLIFFYLGDKQ